MTASDRPPPASIANFARNFISGLHHEQRHSLPPGATLLSYLQTAIGQPADAVPHEPWLMRHKRRPALPRQSAAATAPIDLAPDHAPGGTADDRAPRSVAITNDHTGRTSSWERTGMYGK